MENERFGLVFAKTGSIISGTAVPDLPWCRNVDAEQTLFDYRWKCRCRTNFFLDFRHLLVMVETFSTSSVEVRVYSFPQPTGWTFWCILFYSTSSGVWTWWCIYFQPIPSAVWTCRVYPSLPYSVRTCRVYPSSPPAVIRAGCIFLHLRTMFLNARMPDCTASRQFGTGRNWTGDAGSSPVLE